MAIRLSKRSISNLKICDSVVFEQTENGGYLVACILDGCRSYLHGTDIIEYPTLKHAKRAAKRHAQLKRVHVLRSGSSEAIPLCCCSE
jgi:hypothetical protein